MCLCLVSFGDQWTCTTMKLSTHSKIMGSLSRSYFYWILSEQIPFLWQSYQRAARLALELSSSREGDQAARFSTAQHMAGITCMVSAWFYGITFPSAHPLVMSAAPKAQRKVQIPSSPILTLTICRGLSVAHRWLGQVLFTPLSLKRSLKMVLIC